MPSDTQAPNAPRYRLLEPIGRGRIGEIHLAEALDPGTRPAHAAVALLDPRLTGTATDLALLREQTALLSRLDHPTIARTLALSRFPEGWGLVMEYARGLDLDLYRIAGALPPRVAAEIVERTATALRAALELPLPGEQEPLGLCHGDLVPSLVRLDARGGVKVCGFGLSAQEGPDPLYAAPERLHGEGTPRADIYSLALIAVRLLSGRDLPPPPALPAAHQRFVASALDAVHQRLDADLKGGARFSVEPLLMMLEAMLDPEPRKRPTAQRVQLGCRSLLGVLPGAWLEPWSAQRVPELYERAVAFARQRDPSPDHPQAPEPDEEPTGEHGEPSGPTLGAEEILDEEAPTGENFEASEDEPTGEPEGSFEPATPMPAAAPPDEDLEAVVEEAAEQPPEDDVPSAHDPDAMSTLPGVPVEEIAPLDEPAREPDRGAAPVDADLDDAEDVSEHLEDSLSELDGAGLEPLEEIPAGALAAATAEPALVAKAPSPEEPTRLAPKVERPVAPPVVQPRPAAVGPAPVPERAKAPWWVFGLLALVLFAVLALWMGGLLGEGTRPVSEPLTTPPPALAPVQPEGPIPTPTVEAPPAPAEAPAPAVEAPAPAVEAPAPVPEPPVRRGGRDRLAAPEAPVPAAPEPSAAPAPVEPPAPVELPAPAPAAVSGQATVHLEGDATKVLLQAGGGSFPVGQVPPGTYAISAWFGADAPVPAGTLQLAAGESATLRCSSVMLRCSKQ